MRGVLVGVWWSVRGGEVVVRGYSPPCHPVPLLLSLPVSVSMPSPLSVCSSPLSVVSVILSAGGEVEGGRYALRCLCDALRGAGRRVSGCLWVIRRGCAESGRNGADSEGCAGVDGDTQRAGCGGGRGWSEGRGALLFLHMEETRAGGQDCPILSAGALCEALTRSEGHL